METKQEMFFLRSTDRFNKTAYVFMPQSENLVLVGRYDGRTNKVVWEEMTRGAARRQWRDTRSRGSFEVVDQGQFPMFTSRLSSSVCGTGVGGINEVQAWRQRLLRSYAPQGYGTRVTVTPIENGLATFSFNRYNSCD